MLRADFKIHNNKPVHHIKVISDLAEPVWSPYFSIQENGQVFEFPHGDSHSHQLRWYYEVWDEKQNNVAPNSLLCRVHANIMTLQTLFSTVWVFSGTPSLRSSSQSHLTWLYLRKLLFACPKEALFSSLTRAISLWPSERTSATLLRNTLRSCC